MCFRLFLNITPVGARKYMIIITITITILAIMMIANQSCDTVAFATSGASLIRL
jgi:hypothetical protein